MKVSIDYFGNMVFKSSIALGLIFNNFTGNGFVPMQRD